MEPEYIRLKEIKPQLTDYIRDAMLMLKQAPVPDEKVVHDVRVLMKKCRAVMRLISGQIEKEAYERDYLAYREVGRLMGTWRETSVHRKTLKDLKKRYPVIFEGLADRQIIENLMKKQVAPSEPDQLMKENLELIDEHLSKAGYRLRFQTWNALEPKLLLMHLEESYKTVTDVYLACRHNPKPDNIHRFRKRTKDFLYQLWFFRPLNPHAVKNLEKKLDMLTQNLGRCNDLSVLLNAMGYKYSGAVTDIALDELALRIREEQDRYLSKVWPVSYKIFCPGQNLINKLGFKILII